MSRGVWRRKQLPVSLIMVLFLALAYLTPIAATAQGDLASPVVEESTPTVEPTTTVAPTPTEESEFGAAAVSSMAFDADTYAAPASSFTTGSLTITITGATAQTTYALSYTLPFGVSLMSVSATPTGLVTQCSTQPGAGNLNGLVASAGSGSCVINFTISVAGFVANGVTGSLGAESPVGTLLQDTAEFTVGASGTPPTAAWDQPNYSLIQGESVQMVLTITYSGAYSSSGDLRINSTMPAELDFTVVSAVASSAAVTCSVSGAMPSSTVFGTVSAAGPGTCTVTLNVTTTFFTQPSPFKFVDALVPGIALPTTTMVSYTPQTPPTAGFDQISYNVQAGSTVRVNLIINYMGTYTIPGTASITSIFPGVLTFTIVSATPSSPAVTCTTNTAGPAATVSANIGSTGGGSCSLAIDVLTSPSMPTSSSIPVSATIQGLMSPVTTTIFGFPAPPTAAFDMAGYSALPGGSANVALTITYPPTMLGAGFLITLPGPAGTASFSNVTTSQGPSLVCNATIQPIGLITVSISTLLGGSCTISFTVNIDSSATPGLLTPGLVAHVQTATQQPSASFTVLTPSGPTATATATTEPTATATATSEPTATPTATIEPTATATTEPTATATATTEPTATATATTESTATATATTEPTATATATTEPTATATATTEPTATATATTEPTATATVTTEPTATATATVPVATEPTAAFDQPSYSVAQSGSVRVVLTITFSDSSPSRILTIANPLPFPGLLTLVSVSNVPTGLVNECTAAPSLDSLAITGSVGSTGAGTCTVTFDINAGPFVPVVMTSTLRVVISDVAVQPTASFTLNPLSSTAVFDQAAYAALPGESVSGTLTMTFTPLFPATAFTIFNPGAGGMTSFSAASFTNDVGVPCTISIDSVSGNIIGTATPFTSGHCTISFTIAVDPSATPGQLATALTASLSTISPDPSATFTVLTPAPTATNTPLPTATATVEPTATTIVEPTVTTTVEPTATATASPTDVPTETPVPPLTIDPITITVVTGQSVSGNLSDYVDGGIPPYTFVELVGPTFGTLTLGTDGTFTYQAGASGTDTFTFTVTDSQIEQFGAAASAPGTVNIVIAAPTASPTSVATLEPGVTPTETLEPGPSETPDGGSGGVSKLPSTGSGADGASVELFGLLLAAATLFAGAAVVGRRRISR